jgi:putative ABC transport system permease protein
MLVNLKLSILTTFQSLLSNKIRSFLTILSIIIGVSSVILIMSVGASAQDMILSQVKTFGSDLIGILPGKSDDDGPPAQLFGILNTTLTYKDALSLSDKKNVPNLIAVAAYSKGIAMVGWKSNSYDTNVSGTTHNYIDVEGGKIEIGRFFTEDEEKNMSKVAILGSKVKQELFGDSDAVGQKIKFKKHSFEVIGIMQERGTVAFQDYDDQIIIPLITMQKLINGVDYLALIRAKVDKDDNIERALEDIILTLREQHGIKDQTGESDDFTVRSSSEALDILTQVTDALRYFLAAMAALSLLVGGIGIMNIMLINVSERTREIGLRKAVGANNTQILLQFLQESIFTTLSGGIIGIFLGYLIAVIIYLSVNALGYSWNLLIPFVSIFIGIGVSAVIGLIFGIYPAFKASKKSPIEALRYE